jgi:hypothetical protein
VLGERLRDVLAGQATLAEQMERHGKLLGEVLERLGQRRSSRKSATPKGG